MTEPQVPESKITVAAKHWALRLTGDQPIALGTAVDTAQLKAAFTLEAWIRPNATHRGVVVFADENLQGNGVGFAPGRYDDLAQFRVGEQEIQSMRVPPNYRAVLFSEKGCTGNSLTVDNDVISLGANWSQAAHSLLVFDLSVTRQSFAVAYSEPGFEGSASVITVRRYENLSQLQPANFRFAALMIPTGLTVTLYDSPGCVGEWEAFHEDVDDLTGWDGEMGSLAVTSAVSSTSGGASPPEMSSRRIQIFTATSGDGLALDVIQPASAIFPPEVQFMGAKLNSDRWHHIALTFDGNHALGYLNGRVVSTSHPETTFDFSGEWTIGNGFYGDIGTISVFHAALSSDDLVGQRYDIPQPDTPNLAAGWALERDMTGALVEILSGETADLPEGEAFWVAAQMPRSVLESGLGQQALSKATQRSNAALHQARLDGQAEVDKARQKSLEKVREAHDHAQSKAHASRIDDIRFISGGALSKLDGKGQSLPSLDSWMNAVVSDIAVDSTTSDTYLAFRRENSSVYRIFRMEMWANETGWDIEAIFSRPQPVHALTIDPKDTHGNKYVYWIEGVGTLCRGLVGSNPQAFTLLPVMIPGRDGEWAMAFDSRNQRLFWSNGREIWSGTPTESQQLIDWHVIVSHGRSPHPIALTVDNETGDLYWLDKDLEMVRTLTADGNRIRDLYEALDPREGITLDYIEPAKIPGLTPELAEHPAITLKRLYWNAEYRQMVEAAIIDDPGVFCWFQYLEGQARPQNNISALEDMHFVGVKWSPWFDEPQELLEPDESLYHFYHTPQNGLHGIVAKKWVGKRGTRPYEISEWDMASGERRKLFDWDQAQRDQGNVPTMYAVDQTGSRFFYSNGRGAAIYNKNPAIKRIDIEEFDYQMMPRWLDGAVITSVAFSANGDLVLVGCDDNTINAWEADTGEQVFRMGGHTNRIQCLTTYAVGDKQYVLSGSYDGTVKQWDLSNGECVQTLSGHSRIIMSIAVTDDGRRVVSGSFDNTVKVWDMATGACLKTLTGHTGVVLHVTIHPDGKRVISSSYDKTLKMWDITTGECLRTFEGHVDQVYRHAMTDDGFQLISLSSNQAWRWDMHRHGWVLNFDGKDSYVNLGPLFLTCDKGFSVELQIAFGTLENEMPIFCLGNGTDDDNISLSVNESGQLAFVVQNYGTTTRIESDATKSLNAGEWCSISLVMDPTGLVRFQVNGGEIGNGQIALPRTCLRLNNEIGRSNLSQGAALHGELGMLRLWNRALTPDEVTQFHQSPLSAPYAVQPNYHRSVMEYRNGHPYLMSGMSDGSTPPIYMFELAVDKGLAIQSKSTVAHARLIAAQHEKQAAQEQAAADIAQANLNAQARLSAAQTQNKAAHDKAQQDLDNANSSADQQRAEANQKFVAASSKAWQQKSQAVSDANRQRDAANRQAQRIQDRADQQADEIQRAANKNLANAQAEKDRQESRRG